MGQWTHVAVNDYGAECTYAPQSQAPHLDVLELKESRHAPAQIAGLGCVGVLDAGGVRGSDGSRVSARLQLQQQSMQCEAGTQRGISLVETRWPQAPQQWGNRQVQQPHPQSRFGTP
jgi:hypothetical protein